MLLTEQNRESASARWRRRVKRRLVPLVLLVCGVLALFGIRRIERAMTFHPERYAPGDAWRLPARGEDVWLTSADNVRLHGWFVRAAAEPAVGTFIYFHGNGGNLSYIGWLAEALSERGFDVLMLDYRGYGRSEGEALDEHGIYADADAAYDYLTRERKVSPERIILYGQSLGTTAAVDVASRRSCAGVVLESGLSSAREMAALILPPGFRWLHGLAKNSFASTRKLESVRCPVLVTHGALDRTIPVEQGQLLYNAAREPKRLLIIPDAGHNDMVARGGKEYLDKIASFAREAVERNVGKAVAG